MKVNVCLTKEDINAALKEYVRGKGFVVDGSSLVTFQYYKGDMREPEYWTATVCCASKDANN